MRAVVHCLCQQVLSSLPPSPLHPSEKTLPRGKVTRQYGCLVSCPVWENLLTAVLMLWFSSENWSLKLPTLIGHLQFPLGLVFTVLFLFTQHFIPSLFPSHQVVYFVHKSQGSRPKQKNKMLKIHPGGHLYASVCPCLAYLYTSRDVSTFSR